MRMKLLIVLVVITLLVGAANASISPVVTEVGKISWCIDGLGLYPDTIGIIQVEKPAGAMVKSAYMAAATTGFRSYQLAAGDIKIDGADVVWTTEIANSIGSYNYWADVTSLVEDKINAAPAGRIDFTITESPDYDTDGELLVVIFDDPAQTTDNTIILMFGAQLTTGDNFNILLAEPLDLTDPNLALDFSLASSYSYQESSYQFSVVDVNGQRMTSWAGGNDDGITTASNGNLFTVGGLDDNTANPADPNAQPLGDKRYDDELYSLLPFVQTGDTSIAVSTLNPSNDDNLLFAGLYLRSVTASIGQILLSPTSATNTIDTMHTVTATVQDEEGNPIVGKTVTFTIISGPNTGLIGTGITDIDGKAQFSYSSDLAGTDTITASFMDDSGTTITSNEVTKTWELPPYTIEKDFRFTAVDFTPYNCGPDGICGTDDDFQEPADLGMTLPDVDGDGKSEVKYVLNKKGEVTSTNPGQLYAVIPITGIGIDTVVLDDALGTQFDVNPGKLGGGVEVLKIGADGLAEVLTDTPQVTFASVDNDAGAVSLAIDLDMPLEMDEELMIYIKYQTALKFEMPDITDFTNTADVTINEGTDMSAVAVVEFV